MSWESCGTELDLILVFLGGSDTLVLESRVRYGTITSALVLLCSGIEFCIFAYLGQIMNIYTTRS